MPVLSDSHLHTSFSADSEASMDSQIRAAIDAGLESICFTEHVDLDSPFLNTPPDDPASDFRIDYEAYHEAYLLKKIRYSGQIRLFFGLELGLNTALVPQLHDYLDAHPDFDFVIGSTHSSRCMDPYYDSFFAEGDPEEAYRRYFADALANVRSFRDFDAYGHLDYILRYGPSPADGAWIHREDGSPAPRSEVAYYTEGKYVSPAGGGGLLIADDCPIIRRDSTYCYEKYADLIDPILFELILNGKALEVNTSALRKGFPEPNPGKAILQKYHDFGGRLVTVGADAHVPEGVAYGFDRAEALLKECGFCTYVTYEGRKPVFHEI